MKTKNFIAVIAFAAIITSCNNDATDNATESDSSIKKSDTRRNTDVTSDPLYDTATTEHYQKKDGTPTKPNSLNQ